MDSALTSNQSTGSRVPSGWRRNCSPSTRPCTTFLGLTYSAASPLLASWSVYCLTMALCWKWFASEDELEAPCEIVVEETEVLRPRLGNSAGTLTTTRYYSST
jgi:hypothetical protein